MTLLDRPSRLAFVPFRLAALVVASCVAVGCRCGDADESGGEGAGTSASGEAPAAAASKARSARASASATPLEGLVEANSPRASGNVPVEFPPTTTSAKPGDFVLAPAQTWIDLAFEKGVDTQIFVYYGGWMKEPGPKSSVIRTLTKRIALIPNSMIIPIRPGEKVQPGDVVLTAWSSGSGLQRAIVVEGGTPSRPKVRYLDMALDNPSGWGTKVDQLPENTFHRLHKPGVPGTSAACRDGERLMRYLVTARTGERLLALGFAGRLKAFDVTACRFLPVVPDVKVDGVAHVPVVGRFISARVSKVDAAIGRVFARFEVGGAEKEQAFPFTNVAAQLD